MVELTDLRYRGTSSHLLIALLLLSSVNLSICDIVVIPAFVHTVAIAPMTSVVAIIRDLSLSVTTIASVDEYLTLSPIILAID